MHQLSVFTFVIFTRFYVSVCVKVTTDPHQLQNLYANAPADMKTALAAQLAKEWNCSGQVGDNPCNW